MNALTLSQKQKQEVCDLCGEHKTTTDYTEDFELQTALGDYVEKLSGEKVNISEISRLCESCYEKVSRFEGKKEAKE